MSEEVKNENVENEVKNEVENAQEGNGANVHDDEHVKGGHIVSNKPKNGFVAWIKSIPRRSVRWVKRNPKKAVGIVLGGAAAVIGGKKLYDMGYGDGFAECAASTPPAAIEAPKESETDDPELEELIDIETREIPEEMETLEAI